MSYVLIREVVLGVTDYHGNKCQRYVFDQDEQLIVQVDLEGTPPFAPFFISYVYIYEETCCRSRQNKTKSSQINQDYLAECTLLIPPIKLCGHFDDQDKKGMDDKDCRHPQFKPLASGEKDEEGKDAREYLGEEGEVDGYHVNQGD